MKRIFTKDEIREVDRRQAKYHDIRQERREIARLVDGGRRGRRQAGLVLLVLVLGAVLL